MTDPTDHDRREKARSVKAEAERLHADINMFLKMGFELGEIGIVVNENGPNEVVPTIMMEDQNGS